MDKQNQPLTNETSDSTQIVNKKPKNTRKILWTGYLARILDLSLFGFVFGIIAFITYPAMLKNISPISFSLLIIFIWVFVETIFLATLGYTPGKYFLGIKVRDINNQKLSFLSAFKRSVLVWFKGFAMGFPIVSLFTMISAYSYYGKNNRTSWDKKLNLKVSYSISTFNIVIAVVIMVGLIILEASNRQ